jgi:hypothetical protein
MLSCRSALPPESGPAPVVVPEPSAAEPRTNTADRWTLVPVSNPRRFTSIINTTIELQEAAGIQRDSLASTFTYSLGVNRTGDPVSYTATLESVSLRGGQRTSLPTASITSPFSFSGRIEKNRISTDSTFSDCSSNPANAVPVIQRSLIVAPLSLRKNMTWSDSVSSAVCSGSIPVTMTAIRDYRVIGETSQGILLERHDRTTAAGEGSQGQHIVRLKTDGSGTAQITIDRETGELLQSTATSSTTAIITASGRDQKFVQAVRERIDRLD